METAYTTYQTALKEVFENIINGRLTEANQSLLEAPEWLLRHVGDLGMYFILIYFCTLIFLDQGFTIDEASLFADRLNTV